MQVIQLHEENQEALQKFVKYMTDSPTRPAIYIGLDDRGEAVLCLGDLTWKELAYIKTCFDMHVTKDWIGLLERDK